MKNYLQIKDTVELEPGKKYYLITFTFSLKSKVFWEMIEEVRKLVGESDRFFWDGDLKVWVLDAEYLNAVNDLLDRYYPLSNDSRIGSVKEAIREKLKSKTDGIDLDLPDLSKDDDEWLK